VTLYPRFVDRKVREAMADTPVVALNGPRQAGKTTLARSIGGKRMRYLTLDDPTVLAAARHDPVGLVRDLDRAVVDEVQRAPDLLLAIKRSVDEDRRPGRFLLTGSAHVLTIPRVQESLAGRMEVVPLYPLSRAEVLGRRPSFLAKAFAGLTPKPAEELSGEALAAMALAGGFPEVLARPSERRRRDWCAAYVDAIVERDVREIAAVAKLGEIPRLLETFAGYSGQLLSLSEVGGRVGLDHKTVGRYLAVLEQLFLVRRLRPWFRNELKRLVKTPKLHFIDAGVLAAMRGQTVAWLRADRGPFGSIIECFVHAELLKQASWAEDRIAFFHYRDKDQAEVDIVLENESGEIVGIEVKAAASVAASDFRGLARLQSAAGRAFRLGVVLYDGREVVPFGDGLVAAPIPCLWG
jgi:hypothetical protein